MQIQITESHIQNNEPSSCTRCVIALALKDALNSDVKIFVGVSSVHLKGPLESDYTALQLSRPIQKIIQASLGHKPIEPCVVQMHVPFHYWDKVYAYQR